MFKKLKRKFVLTNLITSTIVLVLAFSIIYIIAASASGHRASHPFELRPMEQDPAYANDFNNYLEQRLGDEREESLRTLLIALIITGVSFEIVIALISFYLAEQSIKPVREAYLAQKTFVANASHEIKTPLAVIQANLEAADIHGNRWLDNVEKKVDDLARLNQQLLALARMDSVKPEIKLEKTDLPKTVHEVFDFYIPQASEKGIKIKISAPKNLEKSINRPDFTQLLNILADNAIKYGKSKIVVTLDHKTVSIQNDGATIKREDLDHIFDRFYQTDKTSSGVGLGLAIAKSLADTNGWKLSANSDAKSTTFTLQFS